MMRKLYENSYCGIQITKEQYEKIKEIPPVEGLRLSEYSLSQEEVLTFLRKQNVVINPIFANCGQCSTFTPNDWGFVVYADTGECVFRDGKKVLEHTCLLSELYRDDTHPYTYEEAIGIALNKVLFEFFNEVFYTDGDELSEDEEHNNGMLQDLITNDDYAYMEEYVIGCMLTDSECADSGNVLLAEYKWKDGRLEMIYNAIHNLVENHSAVDVLSVSNELLEHCYMGLVDEKYLADITIGVASSSNFKNVVDKLKKK